MIWKDIGVINVGLNSKIKDVTRLDVQLPKERYRQMWDSTQDLKEEFGV